MENLQEILSELGYSLRDYGHEYRARPLYRESDNETVLCIKKDTGFWIDYKHQISGHLEDLVRLTLKLDTVSEAKDYLSQNFDIKKSKEIEKPLVKERKFLSQDVLQKMLPDHSYWRNRGISTSTLKTFKGGLLVAGRMKNRYTFPIFDHSENLVGVSGRYVNEIPEGTKTPKWKHIGNKAGRKYPLQVNYKILKDTKKAILVESIGDMLSLWEAGIKNVIVTFGLDVSVAILNTLLRIDPDKIYISLNNDASNNNAGNEAAKKVERKLLKYFNRDQIAIKLPDLNDFGDMSTVQIGKWAEDL